MSIIFPKKLHCNLKDKKKTAVPEPVFNKIAGLYLAASLKERIPTRVVSDEFCEILKTPF